MKKKSEIQIFKSGKQIKAEILPVIIHNGERVLGAIGANAGINTINKLIEKKKHGSKIKLAVPAGLFIIGCVADATVANKYITTPFQGIATESGRRLFMDVMPEKVLTKMNLSGLDNTGTGTNKKILTEQEVLDAVNELEKEKNNQGTSGYESFEGSLDGFNNSACK